MEYPGSGQAFPVAKGTIQKALAYDEEQEEEETEGTKPQTKQYVLDRRKHVSKLAKKTKRKGNKQYPAYPSAPIIADALAKQHGIYVNRTTVQRDLKTMNFKSRVRRYVPSANPQVLARRAAFCRRKVRWPRKRLRKIVFSDEHMQTANDYSDRRMWVSPNGKVLKRERQRANNTYSLQIWGAVGVGYKSKLVFFPKSEAEVDANGKHRGWRLNGQRYRDRCLRKEVPQLKDRIFMQDGAKSHTCNLVKNYLAKQQH